MKKLAALLLFVVSFFSNSSIAQNTSCNAEFNLAYLNGNTVKFNPNIPDSINTLHYWSFGDGGVSNVISPVYSYSSGGIYTASHTIIKFSAGVEICRDSFLRVVQVQGPPACNLVANFYFYPDSTVSAPLTYHFQNNSLNFNPNDSIQWTFGDGTASNQVNPNHTYTQPGTYTVCLRVQKREPNGTLTNCISEICHTVIVQTSTACNLHANFYSYRDTTVNNPYTYHFQNTTVPLNTMDSIRWTFGDGTSSNQVNPNYTYVQPGTYTVCLRVQKRDSIGMLTNCVSEVCHAVVVVQIPVPCNLFANFYAYHDSTVANLYTYHFVNTTGGLGTTDSIRWTFGDGTSSNQVNPNHTYAQPGTYTVCLRVQKRDSIGTLTNCVSEVCLAVVVVQIPVTCNLSANFYAYHDSTVANLYTYHFVNTTGGLGATDSVRWTFGDGTSSNQANPNHTYTQPGTYTVCLRVQKRDSIGTLTNCVSEICHTVVVIQIPVPCNLVANFYSFHDSTVVNSHTYHFVNTTTGLSATDSIRWTFGDGTSSNQVNPTHSYAQAGTYSVCLRVQKRNSAGVLSNCVSEICHTLIVSNPCNIQAHFSWVADSINHRKIYFTNHTVSPTANATAFWSFGDGTTATSWNAVHEYAQPGRYYVCLKVEAGPNCVSYSCDSITIAPPSVSCIQQSHFSFVRANANGQLFYFTPLTINTTWQYTWTFGDGTGSHDIAPNHLYAQPGNYTVCLTVYRNANCASTTCIPVNAVSQAYCDSVQVSYSYQADPAVPNKLYFHAISNFQINSQIWTITKLPSSSGTPMVILQQNNPVYVFQDTGYYRVCLRAVTMGGCIKEYCQLIHITQVVTTNVCTLQPYPNPATSSVSVNVYLALPQMIDVYIYSTSNILVKEKHQQGNTGNNVITVPIGGLVSGTYIMKVIHGNDICYAQFVKL